VNSALAATLPKSAKVVCSSDDDSKACYEDMGWHKGTPIYDAANLDWLLETGLEQVKVVTRATPPSLKAYLGPENRAAASSAGPDKKKSKSRKRATPYSRGPH